MAGLRSRASHPSRISIRFSAGEVPEAVLACCRGQCEKGAGLIHDVAIDRNRRGDDPRNRTACLGGLATVFQRREARPKVQAGAPGSSKGFTALVVVGHGGNSLAVSVGNDGTAGEAGGEQLKGDKSE